MNVTDSPDPLDEPEVEERELLRDIDTAERQLERGEGVAHDDARIEVISALQS